MRIAILTVLALIAFAANSVLCRLALGTGSIDAASFTTLRLVSGALAWGVYSLRGRGSTSPIAVTADNFARSVPIVLVVTLVMMGQRSASASGLLLAVTSGALASGLGYAIWYAALPGLTATRAATVQLCVPVVAALGGVVFVGEMVTLRLVVAAVAVLGGVALAVWGHRHYARR